MDRWTTGYTALELREAEKRFGLRFPPDLFELLRQRRPLDGYDWLREHAAIERALLHPLQGLLFDVEQAGLWWPEWGIRPETEDERVAIVTEVVWSAPRLIPIISHRYIPETPDMRGNPVFSVMQSDVIYYGRDLADFFRRQFDHHPDAVEGTVRYIPFWSELVERATDEAMYTGGREPG